MLYLCFCASIYGQTDLNRAENTILKIENIENPYSKRRTAWLEKKGFDVKRYGWDDLDINLTIENTFKANRKAKIWGWMAAGSAFLGARHYLNNESDDGFKAYGIFTLTSATISFANAGRRKKELTQLKAYEYIPYEQRLLNQYTETSNDRTLAHINSRMLELSFKKSHLKWFKKKGFVFSEYTADNPKVELHLKKAINNLEASRAVIVLAPVVGLAGLYLYSMSDLIDNNPEGRATWKNRGKNLMYASGGFLVISGILSGSAVSHLQKATKLSSR